jgi:hypothetical protein
LETGRASSSYQKEGQVEARFRSEEATIGCDREERRLIRSVGSGVSLVPPSALALTFDAGPDPVWTPRVLDALRRVESHVTFFVIAPLGLKHPGVASAVLEAGHVVKFHCRELLGTGSTMHQVLWGLYHLLDKEPREHCPALS